MAQSDLIVALRAGDEPNIWFELAMAERGYQPGWPSVLYQISRDEALRMIHNGRTAVRVALSQHPDGRVREAAILTFRPDEGLTLDALIRRANDWVPIVAKLAAERVVRLLPFATDEQLIAVLPKVFLLTRQYRVDHRTLISAYLSEVSGRPRLASKIRRTYGSGQVGLWAYRKVVGHDESPADLAREGLRNPQVMVRIEAARRLAEDPRSWPLLMASKNAMIRRIGLDIAPEGAREEALVDLHPGVRNDARYLLGKRDYASFYRAHLPNPGAIAGLGETGRREDSEFIRPFLIDPTPDVRRRALEAYARLLEEDAVDELLLAVQDSSGKVRRAAVQSLARLPVSLDADDVIDRHLGQSQAWALMDRVRRWSDLLAVLRRFEEFPGAAQWLQRWLGAAHKRPMPPTATEAADALVLAVELKEAVDDDTYQQLRHALRPWLRR